ncbi:calpain-A-like isoform X1 [Schistocerca serialis cubense]|uniref:calpain-A-like isoform X1 n=1 Tax=Schistocerca serialis cubense TaxID=2023355 RepID=UPI00214E0C33|nr:calpain-A-like isoform X1 [Schistocerca serialis cubense]
MDERYVTSINLSVRSGQTANFRQVRTEVREWSLQNGHSLREEQRPLLSYGGSPRTARSVLTVQPAPPAKESRLSRLQYQHSLHLPQDRIYKLGEPGSGLRPRGKIQDFYQLRAECLEKGKLFEDPQFPAEDSSIFFSKKPKWPIQWMRPKEIVSLPRLFVEGASRFDVKQGELGDCWFLAAVANLTLNDHLFSRVIPHDQNFYDKYAGIFHFRFWQYGRWIDVVIDDRLPTHNGKLVFLHSATYNEFWSSLLEKAYAKLYGSYEALSSGVTSEAMEDFTGGVTEMFELKDAPPNLYKILIKAYERGALMGCSIEADPEVLEARTPEGLIRGHAYSITNVKYVNIATPRKTGVIPLIRVRNPWGDASEWNGAWSDKSPEWKFISDSEKENIDLTFKADGEFWMSYNDFKKYFTRIEICNLSPDALQEEHIKGSGRKYEMSIFEGEWVRGVTAGGCRNYIDTFSHNPQYRITLEDPDEDDDDDKCTVIIALMQKNRRLQKKSGANFLSIGFAVYHLPNPDSLPKPLDTAFFKRYKSAAMTPQFINLREVTLRLKLPPGVYCIVPSTFEPNEEGEFIIRVFSENKINMQEHDEEVDTNEVPEDVTSQMEKEDQKQEDKIRQFFSKIAGDDMEVDWKDLKQLLDYVMANDLPSGSTNSGDHSPSVCSRLCGVLCCDTSVTDSDDKNGFSKEICRSMVAMKDTDKSGRLGYEEFISLWKDIRLWRHVFKTHDRLGNGTLSTFGLREALNAAGYKLNSHILNVLMHRYGTKDGKIAFDDFMLCAVKLKIMIDIFHKRDPEGTRNASFSIDEWIETTLYS